MSSDPRNPVRISLIAFTVSGAVALVYEVIWTRALALVLGSTVYALSTMLATFMGGLAIGSWLGGRLSGRGYNLTFLFGLCEVGIGLSGLLSIPLIYRLPAVYLAIYRQFHLYPPLFFMIQILLCALVMIVPTILMGATFPLVSRSITSSLEEMGKKVGDAYSMNTIGAVIGSLAVGFFLIPFLGIKGATFLAAGFNLVTGLILIFWVRMASARVIAAIVSVFAIAAASTAYARMETSLVNFYSALRQLTDQPYKGIVMMEKRGMREVFYEEYPEGPVRAFRDLNNNGLLLQVGGKVEGTAESDVPNTVLLAYLPIASHPDPKNCLVIGLGAGITLGAAKDYFSSVDVVEINPGVVKAVRLHGRPGLLTGANIIMNDARNYLLTTDKRYDVISSEPSYPTESEVANLFTREFFALAAERLTDNGVYCQWLPYYMLTNDDVTMMLKTFGSVFPHIYLWKIPGSMDLVMVGGRQPFHLTEDDIRARVSRLNEKHHYPLDYVVSRTPAKVAELIASVDSPLNTDDRPVLEYNVVNNLLMGDLSLKERAAPASGR